MEDVGSFLLQLAIRARVQHTILGACRNSDIPVPLLAFSVYTSVLTFLECLAGTSTGVKADHRHVTCLYPLL